MSFFTSRQSLTERVFGKDNVLPSSSSNFSGVSKEVPNSSIYSFDDLAARIPKMTDNIFDHVPSKSVNKSMDMPFAHTSEINFVGGENLTYKSNGKISPEAEKEIRAAGRRCGYDPDKVLAKVQECAKKYNLDPNAVLALMKKESSFNPYKPSPAGAIGPMQLMPGTAKELGVNPYNLYENIEGGCKYLAQMNKTFKGDSKLAFAGYNAGGGAVKKYGGVPPYKETQDYVAKVSNYWQDFSQTSA